MYSLQGKKLNEIVLQIFESVCFIGSFYWFSLFFICIRSYRKPFRITALFILFSSKNSLTSLLLVFLYIWMVFVLISSGTFFASVSSMSVKINLKSSFNCVMSVANSVYTNLQNCVPSRHHNEYVNGYD